jgi:hypothetical protein
MCSLSEDERLEEVYVIVAFVAGELFDDGVRRDVEDACIDVEESEDAASVGIGLHILVELEELVGFMEGEGGLLSEVAAELRDRREVDGVFAGGVKEFDSLC